ncbi:hypothetical protein TWF506_011179 [Arthrobotrys conoides]|uniref:Uncharacterized protein n=1 Tax=Arthrobotrys conoides TaxID=74498 RepID=A0AAN8N688_9PEZI
MQISRVYFITCLNFTLWAQVLSLVTAIPLEETGAKNSTADIQSLEKPGNDTHLAVPKAVINLDNTNQTAPIRESAGSKKPPRADFDGSPYIETAEVDCQSPRDIIEHWGGRSTSELNPDLFFPEDLTWNFGTLSSPPRFLFAISTIITRRQDACYHCQCFDFDNAHTLWRPGAIFSTSILAGGPFCKCINVVREKDATEIANRDPFATLNQGYPGEQIAPLFDNSLDPNAKEMRDIEAELGTNDIDNLFNSMTTVQEMKSGFRHSRNKMLVPDTIEPYYLEGPDEPPVRRHRLSTHEIGELGGRISPSGFKIKRTSNSVDDLHILSAPLLPTESKEVKKSGTTSAPTASAAPLTNTDASPIYPIDDGSSTPKGLDSD